MNIVNATLDLITHLDERRPAHTAPAVLDALFSRLVHAHEPDEASHTEDCIWFVWMAHPNRRASLVLDRATSDIAAHRFDIAETRLVRLLRHCPNYSEAWHKLATLHYLLGRDEESMLAYRRSLELEPRHFAALCAIGEILAGDGEHEGARLAFVRALRLHPFLEAAQRRLATIDGETE